MDATCIYSGDNDDSFRKPTIAILDVGWSGKNVRGHAIFLRAWSVWNGAAEDVAGATTWGLQYSVKTKEKHWN